ncbi:unnamed protein product [Heterobilharzia americana]|nr:unnamed protein product [Heterobilharzia americana]CAH8474228.1 unnamed protein product [Heterobilharzia americana]
MSFNSFKKQKVKLSELHNTCGICKPNLSAESCNLTDLLRTIVCIKFDQFLALELPHLDVNFTFCRVNELSV